MFDSNHSRRRYCREEQEGCTPFGEEGIPSESTLTLASLVLAGVNLAHWLWYVSEPGCTLPTNQRLFQDLSKWNLFWIELGACQTAIAHLGAGNDL